MQIFINYQVDEGHVKLLIDGHIQEKTLHEIELKKLWFMIRQR